MSTLARSLLTLALAFCLSYLSFTAQDHAESPSRTRHPRLRRVLLFFWWVAFALIAALLLLFSWAALSMLREGNGTGALSMGLTALLLAYSILILFLHPLYRRRKRP